jgi:SAM-dependent methyltransferase
MTEREYVFVGVADDTEQARLRVHEQLLDPISRKHLELAGVRDGWRCLDVGAGAGSVARWLAEQVGPHGRVVAADIDLRFLTDLPAEVEVLRHDILSDDLPEGGFDLVHCRTLLEHLPDPGVALGRMVRALRPGGRLVAVDCDLGLYTVAGHPDAGVANEVLRSWIDKVAALGIVDPYFGRRLPDLLLRADLRDVDAAATTFITKPGDLDYEDQRLAWRSVRPLALENGMDEDAWDRAVAVLESGAQLIGSTYITAWGRR